jgi:hypothetical protein
MRLISLEKHVQMVYEEAAKKILLHTPLLFIRSTQRENSIEPLGSGVLFKAREKHFLLTAAHCIQQKRELIKIGVLNKEGKLRLLKGKVVMQRGERNEIDIGVVELEPESVNLCKETHSFLHETQVVQNQNIKDETDYLIVGQPISKTSIDHVRGKIRREPLVFIGKSKNQKFYERMGYDKRIHTFLGYNRRRGRLLGVNEMSMAPDPQGISGCGLWYITSYFMEDISKVEYRLSGIMTEYFQNENAVMATKIERVLAILKSIDNWK